ncbi:MAG TPA: hypothetical protein VFD58_30110 [Blastocatellia bacterium]|nr:hypothetical protein [Blastocatellia bacterium]
MESNLIEANGADARPRERRTSKKEQIISLFTSGMDNVEDLAMITGSRPGYVAAVLQEAGLISGYFDLYTTTSHPMNVYSRFFAGRLGFKDEETARQSVGLIDHFYRQFDLAGDRAGQHHALVMAMTMFNRARWTRKATEAEIFRRWLVERLQEAEFQPETGEDLSDETSAIPGGIEPSGPEPRASPSGRQRG